MFLLHAWNFHETARPSNISPRVMEALEGTKTGEFWWPGWVDWFVCHAGGLLKWLLILYILYYFVFDVCWLSVEFVSNNHKQFPHLYCLLQYFSVEVDQGAKLRFLQNKTSVQGITVWRNRKYWWNCPVFFLIMRFMRLYYCSYFSSSNLFDVHI